MMVVMTAVAMPMAMRVIVIVIVMEMRVVRIAMPMRVGSGAAHCAKSSAESAVGRSHISQPICSSSTTKPAA